MSSRGPWYQTGLGAAFLGTVAATGVVFVVSALFGDWWASLSWSAHLLVIAGGVLLALLIWLTLAGIRVNGRRYRDSLVEKGRDEAFDEIEAARATLMKAGRDAALADVEALRSNILSEGRSQAMSDVEKARDELVERGRAEVRDSVARERAAAKHPRFYIERAPFLSLDDGDAFYLYNGGAPVTNVWIEAEDDFIQMGKPAGLVDTFKGDPLMPGIGKQFEGWVTERGYEEGITFQVHYLDHNQDPQTRPASVTPEQLKPLDREGHRLR